MRLKSALIGILGVALCPAQHIQFGSLANSSSSSSPVIDSAGNLVQLETAFALGFCCGVGTGPLFLLTRYNRDGSYRIIADTFLRPPADTPVFLKMDSRNRFYVGANRVGKPELIRYTSDNTRTAVGLFDSTAKLKAMAFAPDGNPILVANTPDSNAQILRLDAETLNPESTATLESPISAIAVDGAGAVYLAGEVALTKLSPDLQSIEYTVLLDGPATAIQTTNDGTVYVAIGTSASTVSRFSAAGAILQTSQALPGSINGLALDEQQRVIAQGSTQSRDFPATGIFATPCGPDRGPAYSATFLTRFTPDLQGVERSIVAAGLDSAGLPAGTLQSQTPMVLGGSLAVVDLDRDDQTDVACIVSGASYKGLSAVAPGQLVTIFGRDLGPATLAVFENGQPIPTVADTTEVRFNGVRAPILAAARTQLNVVAPFSILQSVWLEVWRNGAQIYSRNLRWTNNNPETLVNVSNSGAITVLPEAPGVVRSNAANEDGSENSAANPAAAGSWVTVFTTGLGVLDSTVEDAAYGDRSVKPLQTYTVRTPAGPMTDVESSTLPGRTVGVTGVRFRVPATANNVLPFAIRPSYAVESGFTPTSFLYVAK